MLPSLRVVDQQRSPKSKTYSHQKEPQGNFKQLKAFLTSANINVHEFIIRRRLNNNVVHVRDARRKSLLSKKNIAA